MSDPTISDRALSRWPTIVAAVAVLALLTLGTRSSVTAATDAARPQTCFPASKWDAKDSKRPCARVVRVAEDGSVRVRVNDADGGFRYSATVGAEDR
jgi:hypothetical protein